MTYAIDHVSRAAGLAALLLLAACGPAGPGDGQQTSGQATTETTTQASRTPPGAGTMPTAMPEPSPQEQLRAMEAPTVASRPPAPGLLPDLAAPAYVPGGERYPELPEQDFRSTREAPLSTFSIDVDTAAYVHVRRILRAGALPPHDAVRIEEMLNYFRYGYAAPDDPDKPFALGATVLPNPWDDGTKLLHVGLQGYDIPAAERPPLNLVLLIDISGSMEGPDRLELAKQAFKRFLERLGPRDRVSIATFAGTAGVALEPTPADRKARIRGALEALHAGGRTAGRGGLDVAYELAERGFEEGAVNRVMLITDGDFNIGPSDAGDLRRYIARKRESGVYLTVLTVGAGNVNDAIAQALAQAGNGQAAHLDGLLEARKVLGDELEANLLPIADDVKIQVEFNPALVESYRLIGYETRALRDRDFRDDRIDAGEVGSGHQVTALYEIVPVGSEGTRDPGLRYRSPDPEPAPAPRPEAGARDEYAYIQLRYKRPGTASGLELARAVTPRDELASLDAAPEDLRFAVAVAAFGEILRGRLDPRDFGYPTILALAGDARGGDPLGTRSEFLQLVRLAESLDDSGW